MDDGRASPAGKTDESGQALKARSLSLVFCTVLFVVTGLSIPQLPPVRLELYIFAFAILFIVIALAQSVSLLIYHRPAFNAVSLLISLAILGTVIAAAAAGPFLVPLGHPSL
jgi:hypothetical protein